MSSELALHNLNLHVDLMESVEAELAVAHKSGAPTTFVTDLQIKLSNLSDTMNQLWDAWNDAMQQERLARIYR